MDEGLIGVLPNPVYFSGRPPHLFRVVFPRLRRYFFLESAEGEPLVMIVKEYCDRIERQLAVWRENIEMP